MGSYKIGQKSVKAGKIDVVSTNPMLDIDSELIERKGAGHPDSICDELSSLISQKYSAYTTEHCDGMVLHHQIDKLMMIGGKTEVAFGKGKFVEPIIIVLSGRISRSFLGKKLPVEDLIEDVLRSYFAAKFPMIEFDDTVKIIDLLTSYAGPGTLKESKGSIANMFSPVEKTSVRGYEDVVANDTSFCVAYEPLSPLESTVIKLERHLTSDKKRKENKWLGTDIKVMAYREGINVDITACIPQIAAYVPDYEAYKKNLDMITSEMHVFCENELPDYKVNISTNTKDKYETQNFYLTVSGASLSGDIGVVGRGNRTNGLITSRKPMSMEGTNGKNPRYYAGFIYAVCTKKIAKRIYDETGFSNIVEIVSQNGGMLLKPWHTRITTEADANTVKQIVEEELLKIPEITDEFIAGNLVNH